MSPDDCADVIVNSKRAAREREAAFRNEMQELLKKYDAKLVVECDKGLGGDPFILAIVSVPDSPFGPDAVKHFQL